MSKADEKFKKLGYKIEIEDEISFTLGNRERADYITFMKETKTLMLSANITIQELQAINEKVKELGWNE